MGEICRPCNGTGKIRGQLCRRCNPSGAIGDIVLGALGRWWARVKGESRRTDGKTVTSRTHRFGPQTTTLTKAERTARQKERQRQQRLAAANERPARRTSAKGQPAGRTPAAVVHGQQSSTAAKKGNCGKCHGEYGLLKGGNVRNHKDLVTGQRCVGGGKPPRGRTPTAAGQGARSAPQRTQPAPARPAGPAKQAVPSKRAVVERETVNVSPQGTAVELTNVICGVCGGRSNSASFWGTPGSTVTRNLGCGHNLTITIPGR